MATAMGKRLEGKTIVITGASSGIGRSTAFEFARTSPKNLKLVLVARRIDTLKQVAEDIVKEVGDGVKVLPVQLDLSKVSEIQQFVGKLPAEFKDIDVLVNNAYGIPPKSFDLWLDIANIVQEVLCAVWPRHRISYPRISTL